MGKVLRIDFEYYDYNSDKTYKFSLTHDRIYGVYFRSKKVALKDFMHYCNTNEKLYRIGKDINRYTSIKLVNNQGYPIYIYELGHNPLPYHEYLENNKKFKKKRKERYSLNDLYKED